ncbi:hypothetical protein EYC80_000908 [Monilinia laxa]|uniref:Uncharacterized protein n=1 Tax=Monilinia laxa TaxID=61186 RepID=A0A5N6K7P0_MONLA|nr:hypothetical protein EYC80_000908 [Monilinia laxa]
MICQIYTDFVSAHPCPPNTFEKRYKLGLLLPVDSKQFVLAWIANGSRGRSVATFLQYYDQDRVNTRKTLVDHNMTSKKFDHTIFLAVRGDFLTDNSPPNACINHIMDDNLKYTLTGPIAVVSERGHGSSGAAQDFQPYDFRILIDFLFNYEGRPKTEVGHACGDQLKGAKGISMSRFKKIFMGRSEDKKGKSATNIFDIEEHRIYRHQADHSTEPDWLKDAEEFLSAHRVKRSISSANLSSFEPDDSPIDPPKSFILPDFLPDWIVQSPSIHTGPPLPSQTFSSIATDMKTEKESAGRESMDITSITHGGTNRRHRKNNVIIRNSFDIFHHHISPKPQIILPDTTSILSKISSSSISATTTSSFDTRPAPNDKCTLQTPMKNFNSSRPRSPSTKINRDDCEQRAAMGWIMSPWMV